MFSPFLSSFSSPLLSSSPPPLALSSLAHSVSLPPAPPLPPHGFVPVFHPIWKPFVKQRDAVSFVFLTSLLLIFLFPSLFSGSTISGGCVKWDASYIVTSHSTDSGDHPSSRLCWREIEFENSARVGLEIRNTLLDNLFSRTFFPAFPLGPMKFYHRERMMEERFEDSRFQLPLFFFSSSSPPFFSPFRRCARVTRIPNFLIVARRRETARKPERSFVPRQLQLSPAEPLAFNEVGRLTT